MPETNQNNPLDLSNPVAVSEAVRKNNGQPVTMQVYFLQGIFGELLDCNGVAEEVIDTDEKLRKYGLDPAEGGTFIKLLGCSYLYKGNPAQGQVFGMEQGKSMISVIPRDIIGNSWLYAAAIILRLVFQRKKFINDAHIYMEDIKIHTIRHCSPPDIRLSRFTREIRRAMDVALKKELRIDPLLDLYGTESGAVKFTDIDLAGLISKITAFGTLIMEMDGAYRFPTQDMFGELDKAAAAVSGSREMIRLVDLMIARNTNLTVVPGISDRIEGVPRKFRFIRKILKSMFFISPLARRLTRTFLLELDIEKVALDEADWYYCLRRNTHNYRGIPLPERLAELARIDKEKGHQYVKIEYRSMKTPSTTIPTQKP